MGWTSEVLIATSMVAVIPPTIAWEDKCKRLLLRFEHLQQRHYSMKVLAYQLITL